MLRDQIVAFFSKIFKRDISKMFNPLGNTSGMVKKVNLHGEDIPVSEKFAVIFIHGFGGDKEGTWGKTADFLLEDPELKNWDLYFKGYNTHLIPDLLKGIWAAAPPIDVVGSGLKSDILVLLNQGYKTVSLCAHSMGGLATQSALLEFPDDKMHQIDSVLMFGTPSMGLTKARYGKFINRQVANMAKGGEFIIKLREGWKMKFGTELPIKFLAVAGSHDEFVPRNDVIDPFRKEDVKDVTGDHLSMVKPERNTDAVVTTIKDKLLHNHNFRYDWEPALIAMAEAKFNDAISIYKKTGFDNLDSANQVNYILALEGIGKSEEADQLAHKIGLVKDNSEAQGVLGGRYKRKYLATFNVDYLNKAYELYLKSYELALIENLPNRIFYPAINLAFLSIKKDDANKAKEFATSAKKNAELSTIDNQWKYATIAEADMHLNNKESAIENYAMAAKKAGSNIREKESMLINAIGTSEYYGWTEEEQKKLMGQFS